MENQGKKADLLALAKEASLSPGVYLMKDAGGGILYVGKAKSLRNRVSSYFQAPPHENPRTEMLVGRIDRFDVILTETEAEALILENTLIKKNQPKFNVRLKDDKAYPYLRIQVGDDFPRLEYVRRVERDGARYFGPFTSSYAARQIASLLTEMFQLRDCSDNTFRHRSRPCLLYQMGKCTAPCVGHIEGPEYHQAIKEVIAILEGKTKKLVAALKQNMADAVEKEAFEAAAYFRDQIRNLELITETQGVVEAGSERDRDVVGLARAPEGGAEAHAALLRIRGGQLIGVQHYRFQNFDPSISDGELLSDFLSQYYFKGETGKPADPRGANPPREILVPWIPDDLELYEKALGATLRVEETPVDRSLLNVARTNATHALEQILKRVAAAGNHGAEALEEVMDKLHLTKLPHRIECYDISNIQGDDAVASRVVFIDGAPDKNLYRRYKIRTVQGSNDFMMMKEVLGRRFSPKSSGDPSEKNWAEAFPDLVVVDGGKGQLSQAVAIFDELQVQGVSVVGLAKARTESDFQAKEVKSSMERIFIPNRKNPVPLLPHTAAYRLLTHVRDEAHRFAIGYHRQVRSKRHFGK